MHNRWNSPTSTRALIQRVSFPGAPGRDNTAWLSLKAVRTEQKQRQQLLFTAPQQRLKPAVLLLPPQLSSAPQGSSNCAPHNTRLTSTTSQERGTDRVCTAGLPWDPSHRVNASLPRSAPSVSTQTAYATNQSQQDSSPCGQQQALAPPPLPVTNACLCEHTSIAPSHQELNRAIASSQSWLGSSSSQWQPDLGRTDASHILRETSAGAGYHCKGGRQHAMQRLPVHSAPRLLRVPASAPRKVPDGFLITQLVAPWRSACTYMSPGKEGTRISHKRGNYTDHSS